jgi:hypothetical protein
MIKCIRIPLIYRIFFLEPFYIIQIFKWIFLACLPEVKCFFILDFNLDLCLISFQLIAANFA